VLTTFLVLFELAGQSMVKLFPLVKHFYTIMRCNDFEALLTHTGTQISVIEQPIDALCEVVAVARLEKDAIFFMMHEFWQGISIGSNDGESTGHSFHGREAL